MEREKRVCVTVVYKITKVIKKLNVKLEFTRIKEHSMFLTEVIFYLNRRSA